MTRAIRVLIGVLVGAVLAMFGHPATRGILLTPVRRVDSASAVSCFLIAQEKPPEPTSLSSASLWVHEASERIRLSRPISRSELLTVREIADNASRKQPDNAFWRQATAVMDDRLDDRKRAADEWRAGARCLTYNDFQSELLQTGVRALARRQGYAESWQLAFAYSLRSDAFAQCVYTLGQRLLQRTDAGSDALDLRYATIVNADLMRAGSRGLAIAQRSSDLIELTTYPQAEVSAVRRPKRLHLGKVRLLDALRAANRRNDYRRVEQAFIENEAWREILLKPGATAQIDELAIRAMTAAAIPFSFFIVGVVASLYLLVVTRSWKWPMKERIDPRWIVAWGAAIALVGAAATHYWLVAASLMGSVLFLMGSPKNRRSHPPDDMGPLYRLTTFSLSLAIGFGWIAYVAIGLPSTSIAFPTTSFQFDLHYVRDAIGGSIAFAFCIQCLVVPIWAFVVRVATPHLLHLSCKRLGMYVAVLGIGGSILAAVAAVAEEKKLISDWTQIVANEPLYYLKQ